MSTTAGRAPKQRGFTLIEILIALALGLLLTSALLTMFLSSKQSYAANERIARIQANGRTALFLLTNDLRHANFWGGLVDANHAGVFPSSRLTGTCASWAASTDPTDNMLLGSDDPLASALFGADDCLAGAEVQTDAGAVAIKRVDLTETAFGELAKDEIFLRTHAAAGRFLRKGTGDGASPPGTERSDWRYEPRLYFVRDHWLSPGDGVPALCAVGVDVSDPARLATECLVEGIESLHIEYGIDTSDPSDGVPDEYLSAPTAAQALGAVIFKIYVLVRDVEPDFGYSNSQTYRLGGRSIAVDDNYRRAVFSTTVIAPNQRNLPIR